MTQLRKLSLTSDRDYLKIHSDGPLTISATGTPDADSTFPADPLAPFGFAGSVSVPHSLNSIPLFRAFYDPDKNGVWYNALAFPTGFQKDPWLKAIASTTELKLIMNTNGAGISDVPVFYRIYDLGEKSADSDSRIDKIFLKDQKSGTVAAAASSSDTSETIIPIPHPGGEAPLFSFQFSENQIDWYGEGARIVGGFDTASGPPGGPYARYFFTSAYGYVDNVNLYIVLQSNYGSSKTLYVRYECDYRK